MNRWTEQALHRIVNIHKMDTFHICSWYLRGRDEKSAGARDMFYFYCYFWVAAIFSVVI
jgi:hypothetical protein